jgi:hypothetical protein
MPSLGFLGAGTQPGPNICADGNYFSTPPRPTFWFSDPSESPSPVGGVRLRLGRFRCFWQLHGAEYINSDHVQRNLLDSVLPCSLKRSGRPSCIVGLSSFPRVLNTRITFL